MEMMTETKMAPPAVQFGSLTHGQKFILSSVVPIATPDQAAFIFMKLIVELDSRYNCVNVVTGSQTVIQDTEHVVPVGLC
jgi:hypothetical protein